MKLTQALGQYLELYRASKCSTTGALARLNRLAADAMPAAIEKYKANATDPDETRLAAMFAPDYGVNINRVDIPADIAASFRCGVPQLNSLLVVVANDIFHATDSLSKNMPEGMQVKSLRDDLPEEAATYLFESIKPAYPEVLANSLLAHDGVYIHVDRGIDIEKPVQIVNIFSSPVAMLTPRRVLIVAEENSRVRVLLCDHTQNNDVQHLNSQVVQIVAKAGAQVELYDIEESGAATNRVNTVFADIHKDARLVLNSNFLHGGVSRNEFIVNLEGDGADANLSGLGICADKQMLDTRVTLRHNCRHGNSRQIFKNALYDEARGFFGGKIIVEEGAEHTDAAQTNRNILVSEKARMQTSPQLEIYCDEVKCSHGATTGQLDERAMFYMQTRGIPADEARRMLTQAFMADVVDNISFEVLRQRLHILVEKRLSGAAGSCETCATSCRGAN